MMTINSTVSLMIISAKNILGAKAVLETPNDDHHDYNTTSVLILLPPFLCDISKYKITSVLLVILCRQVTGWREYRPIPSPSEDSLFQDGASVSRHPIMEPTKVQSEGGLNVTLTIRLLMHGKVSRRRLSGSG